MIATCRIVLLDISFRSNDVYMRECVLVFEWIKCYAFANDYDVNGDVVDDSMQ